MSRADMLLVEDDAALAELLTYHFRREDFEVRHTPDGEEALLLAQESPPDIVLLDWMVESLSGIEVCRRLRRMSETANVPIIMLTARGEEEDRVRGLETGADDYVTKPFSPRELVARVGAVLRRVRPALAGEQLTYADLEMDTVGHKVRRGGEVVPDSGERVFPVADVGVLAAELLGSLAQEVEVERVDRLADAAKIGAPGIEILKQPQREREDRICEWIGLDTVGIPSQRLADASRVERGLGFRHGQGSGRSCACLPSYLVQREALTSAASTRDAVSAGEGPGFAEKLCRQARGRP